MLVIDPRQGRRLSPSATSSEETTNYNNVLQGRVCLFSNSKPNATELLLGVKERLGGGSVVRDDIFSKSIASLPAPNDLIEAMASQFDTAILAIAD